MLAALPDRIRAKSDGHCDTSHCLEGCAFVKVESRDVRKERAKFGIIYELRLWQRKIGQRGFTDQPN